MASECHTNLIFFYTFKNVHPRSIFFTFLPIIVLRGVNSDVRNGERTVNIQINVVINLIHIIIHIYIFCPVH